MLMRKIAFFLVLLFSLLLVDPLWAAPQITGKSAVLIDAKSGQVLVDINKDEKLPPASTTKILTAIIAIESGKLEELVTVSSNPPQVDGTRVYLEEGEKIKLDDLVRAALIHSANDAALAIAEHLAGSEEEFAKIMNDKARALGAKNSNFVSSHGLSVDGHYTTAYDLALISQYAMKNPVFSKIAQAKVLDWEGQAWQTRLINKNKMLWRYEGITGVKPGYTSEAHYTLVASAEREKQSYITVVLGSPGNGVWNDAEALLDYGFDNYQIVELAKTEKVAATLDIGAQNKLQLVPQKPFSISIPSDENKEIDSQLVLKPLAKNIVKGQEAGELVFSLDGQEIGRVPLLANNEFTPPLKLSIIFFKICAGLFILQVMIRIFFLYRRKKRKKKRFRVESYYRF